MKAPGGMKQNDIKPCLLCGKGVMHTGSPAFFRVKLEHMCINLNAVHRQAGLEQLLGGNASLAFHMGMQEDIASPVTTCEGLICQSCALERVIFEAFEKEAS